MTSPSTTLAPSSDQLFAGPPDNATPRIAAEKPELVIAFVGAVGVPLKKAEEAFESRLNIIGYRVIHINIAADILSQVASAQMIGPETQYMRIGRMMDAGNDVCARAEDEGFLALGVAAEIAKKRPTLPDVSRGTAYFVHSLKRPDEVRRLRQMYPRGFYVVGVHASRERRLEDLETDRRMTTDQAEELMDRDMKEDTKWGQRLVDTFHLADFFVRLEGSDDRLKHSIWRITDLLFGQPYITPAFGEYAMFLAFSASLRSGDLSRQVGAVIARDGEILATGANDCPRAEGGLYWPSLDESKNAIQDHPRGRDFTRGSDSNKAEQTEMIEEIVESFGGKKPQQTKLRAALEQSSIRDLTEFGRVVHAEMEALLSCARKGVVVKQATMYCTTFPCHNCAKHIIAAGIQRVVFVEPYLKSRAFKLHDDAVSMSYGEASGSPSSPKKVFFEPFVGVGPRPFLDLFSMNLGVGNPIKRKNTDGTVVEWSPEKAEPRITMLAASYRHSEADAARLFKEELKKASAEDGGTPVRA